MKRPNNKYQPKDSKEPKAEPQQSPRSLSPAWRIASMQWQHPYGWHEVGSEKLHEIRSKLINFERLTWHEILGHNNHPVSVSSLNKEAQKRLTDLKLDDVDELVSLRLTGRQRVWGILEGNIYTILWWDPEHDVCPWKGANN